MIDNSFFLNINILQPLLKALVTQKGDMSTLMQSIRFRVETIRKDLEEGRSDQLPSSKE